MLSAKDRNNGIKGLQLESIRLRGTDSIFFFKNIHVQELTEMLNFL